MAFKNRRAAKRIAEKPCEFCGASHVPRDAAHIIDEKEDHGGPEDWNALSLCPNCHKVFDESLRPKLYAALTRFGVLGLPASWSKNNKLSALDPPEPESIEPMDPGGGEGQSKPAPGASAMPGVPGRAGG